MSTAREDLLAAFPIEGLDEVNRQFAERAVDLILSKHTRELGDVLSERFAGTCGCGCDCAHHLWKLAGDG